jgi:uncharacterized repeat protein (TIGR01451 family)
VVIPASSVTLPGNLDFTVTTPAPGGGTSAALPYTVYIAFANSDLIYNPVDGLLYVSVPGSAGSDIGNCLVGVDPVTGNIVRKIYVGSNPNKLTLSSDGTQLFVGVDGAEAVAQVNLTTGQVVNQFSVGGGTVLSLAAVPGESNSVAVTRYNGDGVTIYDAGVARANTSSSLGSWVGSLAFGSSSSALYLLSGAIDELTVNSTGITGGSTLYPGNFGAYSIQYDNGRLYLSTGKVLDASTGTLLGDLYAGTNYTNSYSVVSDSTLGRAFIVSQVGATSQVLAINESTFALSGSININTIDGITKIVRWGQNGLALGDSRNVYILQSPVVKDLSSSPADVLILLSGPATASTGSAVTYVATVANTGPNQAQGVSLTLTLDASLIVNKVTASQGSCGMGSVFSCDLGNLANGANATLTVSATPTAAGTIESTATVDSVSYDANFSKNQATASTTVTGDNYAPVPSISSISPTVVQAGSGDFLLDVTGSGFTAASTIKMNGVAQYTSYVSPTLLVAKESTSTIADYGWVAVTVSNPSPGGGTSQVVPLTIYAQVNVPANDILFDPYTRQIYATVPSTSTMVTGNSIVTINPNTGTVGKPIAIGSEPDVMAETTDGNYLWVGLSGSNNLAQFNLLNQTLTATIPISSTQPGRTSSASATWLAAMPDSDTTLAMDITDYSGNFGIFDVSGNTGAFRQNFSGIYEGVNPVFVNATELYAYDSQTTGAEFYRYSVDANGLTLIDGTKLNDLGAFVLADGIVYGSDGGIIDPSTTPPSQIAVLPLVEFNSGLSFFGEPRGAIVDPSTQKEFRIIVNGGDNLIICLERYDLNRYVPEAGLIITAPASNVNAHWTNLLRWGQDGLALLSKADAVSSNPGVSQMILLRGPFVTPQLLETNKAASLTSSSITSITHGAGNTLLTLTGSNFAPGVAVTWNGSYRTTTIIDTTHVTVAIPASDLTSAGSGSLVATNPGAAASSALKVTIH